MPKSKATSATHDSKGKASRPWTRHFATAIIACFAALLLLAVVPMLTGTQSRHSAIAPASLSASPTEIVNITEPIRLSVQPSIVLMAGRLSAAPRIAGRPRSLILEGARFAIDVADGPPPARPVTGNLARNEDQTSKVAPDDPNQSDVATTQSAAAGLIGDLAAPLHTQLSALGFDRVKLSGSSARLSWSGAHAIEIADLAMEFASRRDGDATATGTFKLSKEPVDFNISITAPTQLDAANFERVTRGPRPRNARSVSAIPTSVKFKSGASTLTFDGHATAQRRFALAGHMELVLEHTPTMMRALGLDLPDNVGVGPATLRGPITWAAGVLASENAVVRLGNQEAVGAIQFHQTDRRPAVEGTLAIENLNLAPYFAAMNPDAGDQPLSSVWRNTRTAVRLANHIDADLRVSARRLYAGSEAIGKGVATVIIKDGKIHADIANLELPSVKGNVQVAADMGGPIPIYSVRGRFETADASWITRPLLDMPAFRGKTIGVVDVAGSGHIINELLGTLRGRLNLTALEGATIPIDLDILRSEVSAAGTKEKFGWGKALAESTVEEVEIRAHLVNGTVTLERAAVRKNGVTTTATGSFGGASDLLNLKVNSSPASANRIGARPAKTLEPDDQLAILIRGTPSAPQLQPITSATKP